MSPAENGTTGDGGHPSVSVVIPAYNSEGFVAEAIESVYAQTKAPAEVIVVNDGSTDNTESVLRRMDARLPVSFRWVTTENGGSASARNLGISLATGEFLAFLDHDDLWFPEKLAKQLDQFAADPGLTMSFTAIVEGYYQRAADGSLRPIGEPNKSLARGPHELGAVDDKKIVYLHEAWDPTADAFLEKAMPASPIGSLSTVMVRRAAFEQLGGFNEQLSIVDDWLMWLQMAAAGMRIGHVAEALIEHRSHGQNLTSDRRKLWIDMSSACDQFLRSNSVPRRVQRAIRVRPACAHWHLLAAIEQIRLGDKGEARYHIWRAARAHPASVRPGWIRMLGIGSPPSRDSESQV